MKLATLKRGGRDGTLAVVSRDLSRAMIPGAVAPTLQWAMERWSQLEPKLGALYDDLNAGRVGGSFDFDAKDCASPLPRAYQWADGGAYVNHVELVRKARGVEMPESFWTDPLMYQGGSDGFLGPTDDISIENEDWGIDLEAEVAVITDDVAMGLAADRAGTHIKLFMLVNDVSLRNLIPPELAKGFGFLQSKPASAFSPVAATPDELGDAWHDHKINLALISHINGALFGKPNAGQDMTFNFAELVAHAAKSRSLAAGTIIGSGTVSNKLDGGPGKPVDRGGVGYSCIAEIRVIETIADGAPATEFLKFGDRVRIEMLNEDGQSIFGAIDQRITRYVLQAGDR